jgi:uncharacterized membrane protein
MQTPLHPSIVHLPLALTFIMPALVLIFALMIRKNKMAPHAWLIIIGLQLVTTVSGYVALETGEDEEHQVEKVVDKKIIHEHEERAEVFVGATVIALVLSVATFFLLNNIQFYLHLTIAAISLVSCFLAYRTGASGGELVYRHGAASAYVQIQDSESQGILPTTGMDTSETPLPTEENESLKADDNDYGNADEGEDTEEDKQEDD